MNWEDVDFDAGEAPEDATSCIQSISPEVFFKHFAAKPAQALQEAQDTDTQAEEAASEDEAAKPVRGKNAKKNKRKKKNKKRKLAEAFAAPAEGNTETGAQQQKPKKQKVQEAKVEVEEQDAHELDESKLEDEVEDKLDLQNVSEGEEFSEYDPQFKDWDVFGLNDKIMRGIKSLNFTTPTPIQKLCLPAAIQHHKSNIIAAAETGSGKTLAFSLPILEKILFLKERDMFEKFQGETFGLILTPTRELALQVCDHIKAVSKFTGIKAIPIVGGISSQKQERLLSYRPEIIVATPGRLWDFLASGHSALTDFSMLQYLVIDEADRMIMEGHFKDLTKILEFIGNSDDESNLHRKTFLFSATLMTTGDEKLQQMYKKLSNMLGIKMETAGKRNTAVFDLSTRDQVASTILESHIACPQSEKEHYLLYFLTFYPGRTLIFVNSIAMVRRLSSLLALLEIKAWPLHSQMQQRQRMKNLDRFKANKESALICTDVAARGLDIPAVDHVIQVQVPQSSQTYVHRCGRTGRAGARGFSLLIIGDNEGKEYGRLLSDLNRQEMSDFPVKMDLLRSMKDRFELASQLDREMNAIKKNRQKTSWVMERAKELDLEPDAEVLSKLGESSENLSSKGTINKLSKQLKALLKAPLLPSSRKSRSFISLNVALHGTLDFSTKDLRSLVPPLFSS